ncbi:MAG: Uncharacterized protein G01um10147_491 [Microgenomates group bacterium Gr01-1014_7]|nr:MAG: Uncharacterized protein G01um10147_491 [Microgenomates group bacterium Gr01-1014_7]
MDKAILKTLIYADIFDYPLTIFEIHKWLIGKKATLREVEKALNKLCIKYYVLSIKGYYCLSKRENLVNKRKRREKQSTAYLRKAKLLVQILKVIPWIKLVGISGGLAMDNADKKDDIDLILVTSKNRLWVSRILALGLLALTGQRRKAGETGRKIAGKLCLNILLEEDKLDQHSKDIYLAHEVLQMKVLWQRDGIYSRYLSDNDWAFKFLPNWVGILSIPPIPPIPPNSPDPSNSPNLPDYLEILAKWLQLKIMGKPRGMERIEDGALYFHPNDCRLEILKIYREKVQKLAGLDK